MKKALLVILLLAVITPAASAQVYAGFDRYGVYRVGADPFVSYAPFGATSFYRSTYSPGISFYSPYTFSYYSPPPVYSSFYGPSPLVGIPPTYTTWSSYYGPVGIPSQIPVYYRSSFYPTYIPGGGWVICP